MFPFHGTERRADRMPHGASGFPLSAEGTRRDPMPCEILQRPASPTGRVCTHPSTVGSRLSHGARRDPTNGYERVRRHRLDRPRHSCAGWPSGLALIYARDNTNTLDLQGDGDSFPDVTGNVYALKSTTSFNGNPCFQVRGGAVVIGGVSSVGNQSCLNVLDATNAGNSLPQNLGLTQ
jgi:hypothetical protein